MTKTVYRMRCGLQVTLWSTHKPDLCHDSIHLKELPDLLADLGVAEEARDAAVADIHKKPDISERGTH